MKLVTLRTRPIEDPGEWCCRDDNTSAPCIYWVREGHWCRHGWLCRPVDGNTRRPQSCIDWQEEVTA